MKIRMTFTGEGFEMDEERDFDGEELKNGEKIHQQTKKYVVKEMGENPEFKTTTTTFLDEEGIPITEESAVVYRADCGHWVGFYGPHELTGVCGICGKRLCHRCASTRCRRCQIILCPSCSRIVRIPQQVPNKEGQVVTVDEEMIFCTRCMVIVSAEKVFRSFFGGIHRLFSQDIGG